MCALGIVFISDSLPCSDTMPRRNAHPNDAFRNLGKTPTCLISFAVLAAESVLAYIF